MRKSILFLFAAVLCIRANAQTGTPGYIVKINGDTLNGLLQEEVIKDIRHSIKFRTSSAADWTTYDSSSAKAFGYKGGNNYVLLKFVDPSREDSVAVTAFSRWIVKGSYNLFIIYNNDKILFLVSDENNSWLLYNSEYAETGELVRQGNYITRLSQFEAVCGNGRQDPSRVGFSEREIADFMIAIDNCISPQSKAQYLNNKGKTIVHLFVFAGGLPLGDQSQITTEAIIRLTYPQFGTSESLNIGLHYGITTRNTKQRNYGNVQYVLTTRHHILTIPATFQHNFTKGIIQPYIYAGVSAGLETDNITSIINPQPSSQKFVVGFVAGIGVEAYLTKNFIIRADYRYESLLQYPSLGIGYKF